MAEPITTPTYAKMDPKDMEFIQGVAAKLDELTASIAAMKTELEAKLAEAATAATAGNEATAKAAKEAADALKKRIDEQTIALGEATTRMNKGLMGMPHFSGAKPRGIKAAANTFIEKWKASKESPHRGPKFSIPIQGGLRRKAVDGLTDASVTALGTVGGERVQDVAMLPNRNLVVRSLFRQLTTGGDAVWYTRETEFNPVIAVLTSQANSGQKNVVVDNANGFSKGMTIQLGETGAVGTETATVNTVNTTTKTIVVVSNLTYTHAVGAVITSATINFTALNQLKPSARMKIENVNAAVLTLAHGITLPKQVMNDYQRLQGEIETRLLDGLDTSEEWQFLYGDGTYSPMTGLSNTTGIQTYLWSSGTYGDKKADAVRRAMTLCTLANHKPDAVLLHPTDFEAIELDKDSQGRYTIAFPTDDNGITRLWRVPVYETAAVTSGQAWVGDFAGGATVWDREDAAISMATEHAEQFMENKIQLLAEERLAFTVERPSAFVKVTFDSAPVAPPT